ncbi:hypothetical protein LCGC14_2796660, partial [marine sediment metagenome]
MTMNAIFEAAALSSNPMMQCWAPNVSMEEVMARFDEPAVLMTKAETIMRREEALNMKWPLLVVRNERSSDGGDYGLAKHSPGPVFDESANEIQRLRSLLRMVG